MNVFRAGGQWYQAIFLVTNGNSLSRVGKSSCNSGVGQAGKYPLMDKHTKLPAKQVYRADMLIPG